MNPLYETLEYEKYLKGFLQKQIKLVLKGRVIRQGHLVLYGFKNFSIQLFFKALNDNKIRKTEIPIPFSIKKDGNTIVCDYNINKLFPHGGKPLEEIYKNTDHNKFLNHTLTIEIK